MQGQRVGTNETVSVVHIVATDLVAVERMFGWFRFALAAPHVGFDGQPSGEQSVVAWVMMPEEVVELAVAKTTAAMLRQPVVVKR